MASNEEISIKMTLQGQREAKAGLDSVAAAEKEVGRSAAEADARTTRLSAGGFTKLRESTRGLTSAAAAGISTLRWYGPGLAAAGGAAALFGLKFNSSFEQAGIAFDTMLGSKEKGQQFVQWLKDFAATTPFNFTDLQKSSQFMMAMGFSAEEVKKNMVPIGDAVAGLAAGAPGLESIVRALGQMRQAGRINAQDMNQLIQVGIGGWEMVAEASHRSVAQVKKDAEAGIIPADKAVEVLLAGMEKRFPHMMEGQSKSLGGMWSNFVDRVQQRAAIAFQPLADMLKRILPGATQLAGKALDNLGAGLQSWLPKAEVWARRTGIAIQGFVNQHGGVTGIWSSVRGVLSDIATIWAQSIWPALRDLSVLIPLVVAPILGLIHLAAENPTATKDIFEGIALAIIAYKIVNLVEGVVSAVRAIMFVTEGATTAQWALNLAMAANPYIRIAELVGGLVGALIVLEQKTHWVSKVFHELWDIMKKVFGIKDAPAAPKPPALGPMGPFLPGTRPVMAAGPYLPGKRPALAAGGTVTSAGSAWVAEHGPELIQLDRGATVTPLTGKNGATFGAQVVFQEGAIQVSGSDVLNAQRTADILVGQIQDRIARR